MESIEQHFEEMQIEVTGVYDQIKNQLAALHHHFDQFLLSKEDQLSTSTKLICADLLFVPFLLKFGIADVSARISEAISDSWVVSTTDIHESLKWLDESQRKAAIDSALAEASSYAKKGIQEALLYANLLIGEDETCGQAKDKVIRELLQLEKIRIDGNLKSLQHTWSLRQRYPFSDSTTVSVGQRLAALLCCHLKQFSQAEQILQYCYGIAQAQNPLSKELLAVCADICRVYYFSVQFKKLEELGQWTLQAFAAAGHPAEYYWTILFYLFYSLRPQGKKRESKALLNSWRHLPVNSKLSKMLSLITFGLEFYYDGNEAEAAKSLLQACRIGISHFPTSVFSAFTFSCLGTMGNYNLREQFHRQAQTIYDIVAPNSIEAASNLTNLGQLFHGGEQFNEALKFYRQAESIIEIISPDSIDAAINFNGMGTLLKDMKRWEEAEECLTKARSILEITAPMSTEAAINLSNIGLLCAHRKQLKEAQKFHRQALSIFQAVSPKSVDAVQHLLDMGELFEAMKQISKAIEYFSKAKQICEETGLEENKAYAAKTIARLQKTAK